MVRRWVVELDDSGKMDAGIVQLGEALVSLAEFKGFSLPELQATLAIVLTSMTDTKVKITPLPGVRLWEVTVAENNKGEQERKK